LQASLADRLLVMKEGRIIEEGDFDELYRNPRNEYTRLMLQRTARAQAARCVELESELQGHVA
jgi:peptide/nickel transport system ATP-binding protein